MKIIRTLVAIKKCIGYGKENVMLPIVCYLGASQAQEHLADRGIYVSAWKLTILGVAAVAFIGYLMIKLGFFAEEMRFNWENNPAWTERKNDG